MKATAKDLRFQSRELLNTVNRGEEVVITYRDKPCAKLVPYHKERKKNEAPRSTRGASACAARATGYSGEGE